MSVTQNSGTKNVFVISCPRCKKSTKYSKENPDRPFCSADCKNADTIAWADENYSLAGEQADPDELIDALKKKMDDEI